MAWTKEQEDAINREGNNIIVSAGAGSGKTAVLTARVQRKLKSGVHINELLVLTFTNAAAAEMRERIRDTIYNTPGLEKEANLIDSAYITTFDSFALSMTKKYHTNLNVSNNISITDEAIIDMKKHEILDEIFESKYLSPKKKFMQLINDFCLKDDKELKDYILNLYKKIELKYDKTNYLENYMNNCFSMDSINSFIDDFVNLIKEKQKSIRELMISLNEYFDGDTITKIEDSLGNLLNSNNYNEIVNSMDCDSVRLPNGSDPEGKKIKEAIYKIVKEIKDICIYENENEIRDELLSTKDNLEEIVEILIEFDKRLDNYKKENEIYNFNDISRLAIKVVMENLDVREELKNQFNEILVDEYQDTSDTQELFLSLISHNNIYMVGDIKQSIYRFRNANPYIFKEKYDSYRDNNSLGIKIDLLKNFRSREEVLNNINMMFNLFMDDELGGADYKKNHQLSFGNLDYNNNGKTDQDYDIEVITYDKNNIDSLDKEEEEAFIIGNDIKKKISSHYKVFDKKSGLLREANYSDFVILLDRSKNFLLYKRIFEYLNIPLSILKDESLKKDEDSIVIRNLLRLLICIKENRFDNEFKYTFMSISRSFLFKIDDRKIYEYFVNDNFNESELYRKCLDVIPYMDSLSISQFLLYLFDEFEYDSKLITIGRVEEFRIRSEYFYNLCRNYESLGNTIYDFVMYLNEIFDGDYDLSFNVNKGNTNSCRIMTIHKSKGLEYPVCYYSGLYSRFNINELKDKIIFDNRYGIILPKVDGYYKDTILKLLLKNIVRKEEISERIRLFYVALTRAREKIILVMPEEEEERYAENMIPMYEREKYNSFSSILRSIYTVLLPYTHKTDIIGTKEYLNNKKAIKDISSSKDTLDVKELSIDIEEIEEKHYSKESLHVVEKEEQELMDFGTKVHAILEEIDFLNYNLDDYNIDKFTTSKVMAFINSEFMKDKLDKNLYKEYEFMYLDDNVLSHGIIDLLIDMKDYMVIVDYKLKNIDDPNYDIQLNGYRKYIENKSGKKVMCYLYSILNENYREVHSD